MNMQYFDRIKILHVFEVFEHVAYLPCEKKSRRFFSRLKSFPPIIRWFTRIQILALDGILKDDHSNVQRMDAVVAGEARNQLEEYVEKEAPWMSSITSWNLQNTQAYSVVHFILICF